MRKFLTHTKKEIGITLVALVVTIIILLILAGITISQLSGSGLFENAKLAKERAENSQEKEDGILADYESKIGAYINGSREENKSEYITSISLKITADYDKINITAEPTINDSTKMLGYHYFVEDVKTKEIKGYMSTENIFVFENLNKSTTYKVTVVAYDTYNNYKEENKTITTLDAPVLTITDISKLYVVDTRPESMTVTPSELYEYLFNKNINEGGTFKGIMLNPYYADAFIKFTTTKKIKIYAWGNKYSDNAGSSGANAIIQKYNETTNEYEEYKTVPTKTDGSKYELVELEPGNYNMIPAARYVCFDEWEYEIIE